MQHSTPVTSLADRKQGADGFLQPNGLTTCTGRVLTWPHASEALFVITAVGVHGLQRSHLLSLGYLPYCQVKVFWLARGMLLGSSLTL